MQRHYHLIGIGGMGMGALAALLLAKGHRVSGSDLKESEWTQRLLASGARVDIGHEAGHVKAADFVVYSSAVRVSNPELFEAVSRRIPVFKRAEVLAQLVNEEFGITVAGAHGKTTTTSMASALLINAGLQPTTAIGGMINGPAYNARLGQGKYFVAEVDESDGTFLCFKPHISIITNIDFEHVDFFKDWEGILQAYAQFIRCVSKDGCVIVCGEDGRLRALTRDSQARVVHYGFSPSMDVWATEVSVEGYKTHFACRTPRGLLGDFELKVPGVYNVLNALACIALGIELGVSVDIMQKTLKEFSGVKRRFQLKGDCDGVRIIDDYAHHPTEIRETLKAARTFGSGRLIAVFQPHRYSRTKFSLDAFIDSLALADGLVLTDIYAAGEKVGDGVPVQALLEGVQAKLGDRVVYLKKEKILENLRSRLQSGDMVLFLGAGDIYQLSDALVSMLQEGKVGV